MKRIGVSLSLVALCICFCSQARQHGNTGSRAQATGAGQPKLLYTDSKSPWPYMHFVEQGFQDKAGNYWFSTSDGLYRYDGKTFTNYKDAGGVSVVFSPGRPDNVVNNIVEDKAGNIWFGTRKAAIWFDGKTFNNTELPVRNGTGFPNFAFIVNEDGRYPNENPDVSVLSDRAGNIWVFSGFDIFRYNDASRSAERTSVGEYLQNEVVPPHSLRRLSCLRNGYQDKAGNLWFTTGGIGSLYESYRLDAKGTEHPCVLNKCRHDRHNPADLEAHNKEIRALLTKVSLKETNNSFAYTAIMEDHNGNMWFGTWNDGVYRDGVGTYRCDGKKYIARFTATDVLSASAITTICEDKTGKIWFGTGCNDTTGQGNGVFCYDPSASLLSRLPSIAHYTAKDGLCNNSPFSNNIITTITEDSKGVWFGGDGGISYYNGKSFTSFSGKDGVKSDHTAFILRDKPGKIWFGTWKLGLYCYDRKSIVCYTEDNPAK